jgi:hypothetical protein
LEFVTSLSSTYHQGDRTKASWFRVEMMLPVDCYVSHIAL